MRCIFVVKSTFYNLLGFFLDHISVSCQHLLTYMFLFPYHGYDVRFVVWDGSVGFHLLLLLLLLLL
jgi:hypothetical protein